MSQNPLILKILIQTVFAKTGARRGKPARMRVWHARALALRY